MALLTRALISTREIFKSGEIRAEFRGPALKEGWVKRADKVRHIKTVGIMKTCVIKTLAFPIGIYTLGFQMDTNS